MENPPVVITWNFANWITVSLMALLSFMLFTAIFSHFIKGKSQNNSGG